MHEYTILALLITTMHAVDAEGTVCESDFNYDPQEVSDTFRIDVITKLSDAKTAAIEYWQWVDTYYNNFSSVDTGMIAGFGAGNAAGHNATIHQYNVTCDGSTCTCPDVDNCLTLVSNWNTYVDTMEVDMGYVAIKIEKYCAAGAAQLVTSFVILLVLVALMLSAE